MAFPCEMSINEEKRVLPSGAFGNTGYRKEHFRRGIFTFLCYSGENCDIVETLNYYDN